jgi:lipid-A-disaccharide synthase
MKPLSFMIIAGEASGDAIAAELVKELIKLAPKASDTDETQPLYASLQPRFFGAGGPRMAEAGVEMAFDMTAEAVIGFSDVVKKLSVFYPMFRQLVKLATEKQPDVIILVDYGFFNELFTSAIHGFLRKHSGIFNNWRPKIVRYVSPQVWASRSYRAKKLAKDIDLLLCLFPFEKEWYARRFPEFKVECVGHPISERFAHSGLPSVLSGLQPLDSTLEPTVVLLPGSRKAELRRHLPVIIEAAKQISAKQKVRFKMIFSNENLAAQAREFDLTSIPNLDLQVGGLEKSLSEATVAIAKTGTVNLECAYFGVPTVALYKTSWSTYHIARRIAQVRFLSMPNLMADEAVFPEFIQDDATVENITREALDLLTNLPRRQKIQERLKSIIASLGGPGAARRTAQAIVRIM